MREFEKIGCMNKTANSFCRRPVQYVFHGTNGMYYRCGKCARQLMAQCDDVVVEEVKLVEE